MLNPSTDGSDDFSELVELRANSNIEINSESFNSKGSTTCLIGMINLWPGEEGYLSSTTKENWFISSDSPSFSIRQKIQSVKVDRLHRLY